MEKNLFAKLIDRIKLGKNADNSTIKKRIGSIALAASLSVSALGLTSCTIIDGFLPNSSTNPGTNSSQPNNSSNNNNNSSGNNTNNDKISNYSQILQDVLNSSYYDGVIDNYKNTEGFSTNNIHAPIPYDFLEEQGHDVSAIKANTLKCASVAYTKGEDTNTLYLSTRVENSASTPYYTCYVLKYNLTDKEYDDLYMLHNKKYIQSGFFIQELDSQKNPTVLSKANITVGSYDKLVDTRKNDTNYFNTTPTIDLIKVTSDTEITVVVRDTPNNVLASNCKMRTLDYKFSSIAIPAYENTIFKVDAPKNCLLTNEEEYKTTYETITYYDAQDMYAPYLGTQLEE